MRVERFGPVPHRIEPARTIVTWITPRNALLTRTLAPRTPTRLTAQRLPIWVSAQGGAIPTPLVSHTDVTMPKHRPATRRMRSRDVHAPRTDALPVRG